MPTVWNLYLASSDIRATAGRIRDSGGQLIMEPMPVGPFGTMLMAADPGGAVFGVWQAGTHGGFEVTGVPGSYIWTEVYTRETERTDPFYEEVFGFGSKRIEDEAIDFRIFVPEGEEVTPDKAVLGRFRMGRASRRNCPPTSSSTSPSPTPTAPRRRSRGSGAGSRWVRWIRLSAVSSWRATTRVPISP